MAYTNTISIVVKAIDEASSVVTGAAQKISAAQEEVAASAATTSSKISSSLDSAGTKMIAAGSAMTRSITLPTVAVMGATAKMAYDFENQMELLRTSAGIPQSAIASLSDKVLGMAGQVGQSPEKLAQGLYHIASAGNGIWNTSQMLDILKTASEGANLGLADLDNTTYALSSAMASGIKGVSGVSDMMATLVAIVGAGDMKMQDLNGAISTGVLSTMATAGISVQSFGAALATLTDNGEHADEAATRLRMTIALMTSPSAVAAKQLGALGLTAEDAKNATADMNAVFKESGLTTTKLADDLRQPNGIGVAMEDLKTHLEDAGLSASETDAMLSKAFGGGRTDAALLTMLQNTTRLDDKFKAITKSSGEFGDKITDLSQTPTQKFRDSWAGVQADFTKFGESVLPQVTNILQSLGTALGVVTKWFTSLSPWQKQSIVDLALFTAAAGPMLVVLGGISQTVSGIIGLGSGVKDFFTAFLNLGSGAADSVAGKVGALFGKIGGGTTMGSIAVAGALADIGLVADAVTKVIGAINAMNQAKAAAVADQASVNTSLDQIAANIKAGNSNISIQRLYDLQQQDGYTGGQRVTRTGNTYAFAHALGTNFAPGGWSLVGEQGPEYVQLPTGSKVRNARETKKMLGGNKSVVIQNLNVNNNADISRIVRDIGFRMAIA